ncbi:MAG: hypothetical protein GX222_03055 [Ruminococcaceae bacterium]|nr:hypothetical protein [Oscillospiraceae bacterium]
MKVIKSVFLITLLFCFLAGCKNSEVSESEPVFEESPADEKQNTGKVYINPPDISEREEGDIYVNPPTSAGHFEESAKEPGENDLALIGNGEIIDLRPLSSIMVYSQVYDMMFYPENYIGKKVIIEGVFASYHDTVNEKRFFAVVIYDALACCSEGMEFVLAGDYSYPDDYPEEGETIAVEGIFETYEMNSFLYMRLKDARILE